MAYRKPYFVSLSAPEEFLDLNPSVPDVGGFPLPDSTGETLPCGQMTHEEKSVSPEDEGVSRKDRRPAAEEIQIIIYAQSECSKGRPDGTQQEPREMPVEEEEPPERIENDDDVTGMLTQTFDFFCPHKSCSFQSARRSAVVLHVKAKHGLSKVGALRRCPHCDHVTAHVSNLRTHILARHTQHRPWLCDQCGKKFADKSYYNAHMKRHRNDLRYPCPTCDNRFLLPSHLRDHIESRHGDLNSASDSNVDHLSRVAENPTLTSTSEDVGLAGQPTHREKFSMTCAQPVPDHDYYRCINPARKNAFMEMFECVECSSFFASFESLRVHFLNEHRRNFTAGVDS